MIEKDEKNQGKINLTESCRYEGAILNGLPHGQGKLSYGDNYEIEGDFEKGFLKHGMIKDHKKNETYLGEFKRKSSLNKLPMPHGNGKYSFPNSDEYYGTFKDGMFHGSGIYRWGEGDFFGDQYSGQFENNKVHGSGIYTMNDRCNFTGVTHKGVWCNNVFSGKYSGMFDGVLFESEVRDNELNGESKFFFERFILNAQYNNGVLIANRTSTPEGKVLDDWVYSDIEEEKLWRDFISKYQKECDYVMLLFKNWANNVAYLEFDN